MINLNNFKCGFIFQREERYNYEFNGKTFIEVAAKSLQISKRTIYCLRIILILSKPIRGSSIFQLESVIVYLKINEQKCLRPRG